MNLDGAKEVLVVLVVEKCIPHNFLFVAKILKPCVHASILKMVQNQFPS